MAQSTADDVRRLLGEPRGRGANHIAPEVGYSDVWAYDFVKLTPAFSSTQVNVKLTVLMIFLQNGLYAGHIWFSNLASPDVEQWEER